MALWVFGGNVFWPILSMVLRWVTQWGLRVPVEEVGGWDCMGGCTGGALLECGDLLGQDRDLGFSGPLV